MLGNYDKVIYTAGPFRAKTSWEVEQNIRRAELAALMLWKLGFAVICPHANTRFFSGEIRDEDFLAGDLNIVARCDGVLLLSGWRMSEGSRAERDLAKERGIPVFPTVTAVWKHFRGNEKERSERNG